MRFRVFRRLCLLALAGFLATPAAARAEFQMPPESVTAEARDLTWTRGHVYLPAGMNPFGTGVLGGRRGLVSIEKALEEMARRGIKAPVVVYLHGCGGFGNSGKVNAGMLAEAGFVVVAPDSFARPGRIKTCDGKRHAGIGPKGSYSKTIALRLDELDRALEGLKGLSWVDDGNLFLFGHSQGSNAAAYYDGNAFKARVMTGTRCSLGYRAPADEPALAVFSSGDPWFRGRPVKCLEYVGRTKIEILQLDGSEHVVAKVPAARERITDFLKSQIRP